MDDERTASPAQPDAPQLWVANEFASCRLTRVPVGNGHRICIHSERHDRTILLDATALDALTRLSPEQISYLVTAVTDREPLDLPRSNP